MQQHLESNYLLSMLSERSAALLQARGRNLILPTGFTVHEAGAIEEYVYFPRGCVVAMMAVMNDGRATGVALVGREGVIGLSLPHSERVTETRAQVLIGGAALRIAMTRIPALLQECEGLETALVDYQQRFTSQASRLAACNVLHGLEQRLSRWLLDIHRRGDGQPISVTQETLAEILGVHRASLNKELQKLREHGAIAVHRRGTIEVIDPAVLQGHACECVRVRS